MNFDNRGWLVDMSSLLVIHVILSEAKDLQHWHEIRSATETLRFAQGDMQANMPDQSVPTEYIDRSASLIRYKRESESTSSYECR